MCRVGLGEFHTEMTTTVGRVARSKVKITVSRNYYTLHILQTARSWSTRPGLHKTRTTRFNRSYVEYDALGLTPCPTDSSLHPSPVLRGCCLQLFLTRFNIRGMQKRSRPRCTLADDKDTFSDYSLTCRGDENHRPRCTLTNDEETFSHCSLCGQMMVLAAHHRQQPEE